MSTLPLALTLALLLQLFSVAKCTTVKATVYADNYFEFYVDGVLTQKDPLDFTPHQAVAFSFDKPAASTTYAIKAQDYATSSGYEYVNNTQMIQIGDGALRMTFSDGTVSGSMWKCMTTSYGPTAASIKAGCSSKNLAPCQIEYTTEPTDWTSVSYDDSAWEYASTFTESEAGWGRTPSYSTKTSQCSTITDPYSGANANPSYLVTTADQCIDPQTVSWGSALFMWRPSLDYDNTILCRITV